MSTPQSWAGNNRNLGFLAGHGAGGHDQPYRDNLDSQDDFPAAA